MVYQIFSYFTRFTFQGNLRLLHVAVYHRAAQRSVVT